MPITTLIGTSKSLSHKAAHNVYYVKLMLSEFSLHMPVWFLIPNGFCLTSWIWIFILYNQRIMVISMIGLHYCGANLSLRALLARFSPPDFFKTRDMFSDVI